MQYLNDKFSLTSNVIGAMSEGFRRFFFPSKVAQNKIAAYLLHINVHKCYILMLYLRGKYKGSFSIQLKKNLPTFNELNELK